MSEFFSHYPKISYNVSGVREPTKLKIAVDIMNRTKIKDVLLDDTKTNLNLKKVIARTT